MEFLDYKIDKNIIYNRPPGPAGLPLAEQITLYMVLKNIFDIYVSIRQIRVISKTTTVPDDMKDYIDPETFEKSRLYQLECEDFRILKALYRILTTFIEIHLRIPAFIWNRLMTMTLERMPSNDGGGGGGWVQELIATCLFSSIMIILHFVSNIPVKLFETFVLEKNYNFNKQTLRSFLQDLGGYIAIAHIFIIPIVIGILLNFHTYREQYFILIWIFLAAMLSVYYFILPSVIGYVYDFQPLEESSLKTEINKLLTRVEFPGNSIYVFDGSSRSSHSNAFVFGIGKTKKIVLFDTLFKETHQQGTSSDKEKGLSNNEILAVIAHELGHWFNAHVFIHLLITQISLLLFLNIYHSWHEDLNLYQSFGFGVHHQPIIPGMYMVYFYILIPYHFIVGIIDKFLSRVMEKQADMFAATLVSKAFLTSGLIKIYKDNLEFPLRDYMYEILNCSHPSQYDRFQGIKSFNEQS